MEIEVVNRGEVVDLVREEMDVSGYTTVSFLTNQLNNLPDTYGGCCSFGEAFYGAVKTVLDWYLENDGLNNIIDKYMEQKRRDGLVTIPGIDVQHA